MNKRHLTKNEINYILTDIRPIHNTSVDISKSIHTTIIKSFEQELSAVEIYPEKIQELKKCLEKRYYSSTIQPGESVGVITAQSIGEKQTQLTLDTFHKAGSSISTVISGVPRFTELLNATKNPKQVVLTLYLSKDKESKDKESKESIHKVRDFIAGKIVEVTLKHCIKKYTIIPLQTFTFPPYFDLYKQLYTFKLNEQQYIVKHIECDISVLYTHRIPLYHIKQKLEEHIPHSVCLLSPDTLGIIDWFIPLPFEDIHNNHIYIKGIPGIQAMLLQPSTNEWVIEAIGSNMKACLANPLFDISRVCSNNMWEIYTLLGIEATREFLIREFVKIISTDSYINKCHIELLVDTMIYTGVITSISRYGVHKHQVGPLTKASFEESLDNFLKAGAYCEVEDTKGVSAAVMCGKPSSIGSGLCQLIFNDK